MHSIQTKLINNKTENILTTRPFPTNVYVYTLFSVGIFKFNQVMVNTNVGCVKYNIIVIY